MEGEALETSQCSEGWEEVQECNHKHERALSSPYNPPVDEVLGYLYIEGGGYKEKLWAVILVSTLPHCFVIMLNGYRHYGLAY